KLCRAAAFSIPFLGGSSANIPVNGLFRSVTCHAIGRQVRDLNEILLSMPKALSVKRVIRRNVDRVFIAGLIIMRVGSLVNVVSHSLRGPPFKDDHPTELEEKFMRLDSPRSSAQAAGKPLRATSAITSQKRSSSDKVV